MALGPSTFADIGGAVSDLFAGFGAQQAGALKKQGIDIQAAGTKLQAQSLRLRASGDLAEAQQYELAAGLARQNETYTAQSQAIQQMQLDRKVALSIGAARASIGGSGLAMSGSALDILRDSASQGALAKEVLAKQGAITEAGYEEQAKSYDTMAAAGKATATGEMQIATDTEGIAAKQEQLGIDTQKAEQQAGIFDFAGAAIKGAAAIASLFG